MEVILYLPEANECGEKLLQIIHTIISNRKISMFRSLDSLATQVRASHGNIGIAFLYASTRAGLLEVACLGDMLGELHVVLVLPDHEPVLLEKAHLLRPRLITATESDLEHLGGILQRMIELYDLTKRK